MELGELKIPKIGVEPFAFIHGFQTRLYMQYANIVQKNDIGRAVVDALTNDPRVIALQGKMISHGSGAQIFETETLAMWFLWCANEHGPEKAKNYLESFLSSEEIPVINTLWVLGIEVDQPIILNDGYVIYPASKMPDSGDKEYFLQFQLGHMVSKTLLPTCAITKICRVRKAFAGDQPTVPPDNNEFWEAQRRLHDLALLLNAFNGISCMPYYLTSYVEPTTPLGHFSSSGGASPVYDVLAYGRTMLSNRLKTEIDLFMSKYDELDDAGKARISRILNRLSQAKRRVQIEDKMLDLGITLEMLLLEGISKKEQVSLAFRLRGSWLVGTSAEDRIEKFQTLKDIYDYRSQVAHSGILCDGKLEKIDKVRQSFLVYQSLAEQICQKIIKEGKPDWDRLVLGST